MATRSYGADTYLVIGFWLLGWTLATGAPRRVLPPQRSLPVVIGTVGLLVWSIGVTLAPNWFAFASTWFTVGNRHLLGEGTVALTAAAIIVCLVAAVKPVRALLPSGPDPTLLFQQWALQFAVVGLALGAMQTSAVIVFAILLVSIVAMASSSSLAPELQASHNWLRVVTVLLAVWVPVVVHLDRSLYLGTRTPAILLLLVWATLLVGLVVRRWWPVVVAGAAAVFVIVTMPHGGYRMLPVILGPGVLWSLALGLDVFGSRRLDVRWRRALLVPLAAGALALVGGLGLVPAVVCSGIAAAIAVAGLVRSARLGPLSVRGGPPDGASLLGGRTVAVLTRFERHVGRVAELITTRASRRLQSAAAAGDGYYTALRSRREVEHEPRRDHPIWQMGGGYPAVAACYLAIAAVLSRVQVLFSGIREGRGVSVADLTRGPIHSVGRVAWDAGNFLTIATEGHASDVKLAASFPGYPLLIREMSSWAGVTVQTAAVTISLAAGLCATLLLWAWMRTRAVPPSQQRIVLALFLLCPFSFPLYGVAYADGVLVSLVLAALLFAERDRWVIAGLAGAAATYTRPNGLVVIPALALLALERSGALSVDDLRPSTLRVVLRSGVGSSWRSLRRRLRCLRPRHGGVALSFIGIGAFMMEMSATYGDPLYFWSVQTTGYGHRAFFSLDTWLKVEFVNRPAAFTWNGLDDVNQILSTAAAVGGLIALPAMSRRLGLGYAALMASSVAVLWVTAMWFAPGRYLLPALPFLAVIVAPWLDRNTAMRRLAYGASAVALVAMVGGFASVALLNW